MPRTEKAQRHGLTYATGDVLEAFRASCGPAALLHVVNDQGGWGKGLTGQITRKFGKGAEESYRQWARTKQRPSGGTPFELGCCIYTKLSPHQEHFVVHLLAQKGYSRKGYAAVQLPALGASLRQASRAIPSAMRVFMPRIGCGLGGRTWSEVYPLVSLHFSGHADVSVWDLK